MSFIKLNRDKNVELLALNDPNAFIILTIIACRARYTKEGYNPYDLKIGEALIGRTEFSQGRFSMSQQNFRSALKRLTKCQFITIKPTHAGTVVKLLNSDYYDINICGNNTDSNTEPTQSQHRANTEPTTNKKDKKDKNIKNDKNFPPKSPKGDLARGGCGVEGKVRHKNFSSTDLTPSGLGQKQNLCQNVYYPDEKIRTWDRNGNEFDGTIGGIFDNLSGLNGSVPYGGYLNSDGKTVVASALKDKYPVLPLAKLETIKAKLEQRAVRSVVKLFDARQRPDAEYVLKELKRVVSERLS